MTQYVIRRLLQAIPLLLIVSVILFVLLLNSGDPLATLGGRQPPRSEDRARLRKALGLDQPVLVQYVYWLAGNDWASIDFDGDGNPDPVSERNKREIRYGVLRGDFGTSIVTRQPALELIWERLPNTLILMLTAEAAIVLVSLGIGIFAALRPYSLMDNILTTLAFIFFSMPVFWIALMLMYIFAVHLDWFPTVGMFDPQVGKTVTQVAWHMILPVTTIALISIAADSRYIRSAMLDVVNSDYIRTARAKGLTENRILYLHALKNASLPLVTLLGLELPFLLAGAVVTESIFAWPGMGRLFITSLGRSDFPVLMGLLMMISIAVVLFQLLTDIVYAWLDPRIRFT
jgi:peptide/nickel transport system permease protein